MKLKSGFPPKTIIYSQKYLHRDSWLISWILKSTKPRCVTCWSLLQPSTPGRCSWKKCSNFQALDLVVNGLWCGWWNRTLNTWVLGVQKNWSMQGWWVFWEIYWLIQLDEFHGFQTFPPFKRCVKFRKIPHNFSKLQWTTPEWKKQMLIITEMTLDLGSWKRSTQDTIMTTRIMTFLRFFLRLRHPKLSSLEKRHPGKSSCDGYSQWMWCTCACTITS